MSENAQLNGLCDRFRGFYPVVIDVETAGFNAKTDALEHIDADSPAAKILIAAQQKTEEIYISQEDDTD